MPTTPDIELLREFSASHSEAAFDALVRRHLDLVHSAAFRLTRDTHLAEDISQAVFVALARNAATVARKLAQGTPLSAWFHLTTRNLAAKAIRTEVRRRAREQASLPMNEPPSHDAEAAWEQVAPHLDPSLAELSEADRNVVLLRFFERKSAREIGGELGIAEDAAQKRITRAVDRLRTLLARRAPNISATTLLAILGAYAVKQAPMALAASVSKAAVQSALVASPAGIAAWLTRFTSDIAMTKSQTLITGLVVATVAVPLGVQQMDLERARAQLRDQTTLVANSQTPPPGETFARPEPGTDAEAAELARLDRRIEELRAQIAAKPRESPKPQQSLPAQGPLLLTRGNPVSVTNLLIAGNGTPEAAAQSMLALMRDGNLDAAINLWLLSPKDRAEWEDMLSDSPERRDEITQRMTAEVTNLLAIELVDVQPLDERRSSVVLHYVSASETNSRSLTFGHTPSGWKQIP